MPHFSTENSFIAIPESFIKDKLPGANPTFVKVYIYLYMLAQNCEDKEFAEIASVLGLLESDLIHAINYWAEEGVLTKTESGIIFSKQAVSESKKQDIPARKSVANISELISSDKGIADMFTVAQEILGKTITEHDMETVYWFYSELEMAPEVIVMLLEYCVSKGKNRMSYIEKVAISWNEMGLNSPESVAAYIKEEEQKTGFLYSIRKIMGISDRNLSQIEEKYLTKWHEEYGMSEEMIALSYEYCIIQTAKLSFPYMDKILTRWKDENITTITAAEEDNRKFKKRTASNDTMFTNESLDLGNIEKLTR